MLDHQAAYFTYLEIARRGEGGLGSTAETAGGRP
jgi:hypothetical protein